jgi:hypothetical protein
MTAQRKGRSSEEGCWLNRHYPLVSPELDLLTGKHDLWVRPSCVVLAMSLPSPRFKREARFTTLRDQLFCYLQGVLLQRRINP